MANTSMACRAATQMVVALEVKSEGKIGLDKPYLLCYRIKCVEARRTAGPFLPTQADSIPRIRIQFWCLVGGGMPCPSSPRRTFGHGDFSCRQRTKYRATSNRSEQQSLRIDRVPISQRCVRDVI